MRFLYGKQDWKTFERGEENCYLMTNGLGGFSSLSMTGSCSRNDQAVLMACLHSPNHRYNMIHRLEEKLTIGERIVTLSSQDFQCRDKRENGYLYQTRFTYEDYPQWTYLVDGVEVIRTIILAHGTNAVGISYDIRNHSCEDVTLEVYPHLQFVPKGARLSAKQEFAVEPGRITVLDPPVNESSVKHSPGDRFFAEKKTISGLQAGKITSNGMCLRFYTTGDWQEVGHRFCDTLYYADDVRDGKMELGRSAVNHKLCIKVLPDEKKTLETVYGTDVTLPSLEEVKESLVSYRNSWRKKSGFTDETALALCSAASQFISYRASTRKQTILAGFPFFEDWGRDTMIALLGCCLSTRQFQVAEDILRTFMQYCKKGLMPNLFPEGKDAPGYNTADAALLFIIAVYEYFQRTKDHNFVSSAYSVMAQIIEWYEKGTDYGIRMDEDGLIMAGQDYDQVTWMDVRIGDILPTPRHGKPVEINAYWYNALRIMEIFRKSHTEDEKDYGAMAQKVLESFRAQFWNEKAGCLKDVLIMDGIGSGAGSIGNGADGMGTGADSMGAAYGGKTRECNEKASECQIRCNQIWAVSLPFSLLPPEKEKQVVETVFRRLYTPYGLRTLDPADPQFRPFYGGAQMDRDLAYHQGTIWIFPMGAFYLAYLKVNGYSEEAKENVRRQLASMEAALREGCVGQLPEIYDGENPTSSKGCFAQAWSVGEMLRVYEAVHLKFF